MSNFHPEMRSQFLRDKHRLALSQRATDVLGAGGLTLLKEMEDAYRESHSCPSSSFDAWARNVFRGAAARIEDRNSRRQYVATCIRKQIRIAQLEKWLGDHPDPDDLGLDDDERRAIPAEEWAAYVTERSKAERELSALQNGTDGMAVLKERVGAEQAGKLMASLMGVIDIRTIRGERRLDTIMELPPNPSFAIPASTLRRSSVGAAAS